MNPPSNSPPEQRTNTSSKRIAHTNNCSRRQRLPTLRQTKTPCSPPSCSSANVIALGEYQKALDTFSDILKDKEASLTVQRAAAYTYQQRGQLEDPKWLERAIHGGYTLKSTGQNRIWGWLRISQVAARTARSDEKYRDTFYEARFNMARCRYLAAMKGNGTARAESLFKAQQSIQSLAQTVSRFGRRRLARTVSGAAEANSGGETRLMELASYLESS